MKYMGNNKHKDKQRVKRKEHMQEKPEHARWELTTLLK